MFHGSNVPFGSRSSSSDIRVNPSDVSTFRETGLNHFRAAAMTQTSTTTLSAVDNEIDTCTARQPTRSLLSRHNALVLISTLPPELLSRIFHFNAHNEPPFGKQKLGWIRVTHVCRHWRRVALDDSSLWARIEEVPPRAQWISEMLVRARSAPLTIDVLGTPSPEILLTFPPHISHTRELRLRGLSMLHFHSIRDICSSEAPILERFELGVSIAGPVTFRQLAGTTLFNGQALKLRTLSLSQIIIPWSLIPRGQLTQLQIHLFRGIFYPDFSSPNDLNQLIDLLINSPDLEVLTLESCLPAMLSQVSHGQLIHLPCLSRLCLGGTIASVANLLKMLKLPSSATLHLRCNSENSSTHTDHMILPFISAHFHNPTPVEFKSLTVTVSRLERLIDMAVSISPPASTIDRPPVLDGDMDDGVKLQLSFSGLPEGGEPTQADIVGRMCSMLPISTLEFLSISALDDPSQSVNWYELFQKCNNVTTIQAKGGGTIGLLQALAPQKVTNTMTGTSATTTPFPKLTSLLLDSLDLRTHIPPSAILYDILMNALQQREMNKMPLKMLGVNRCVITDDYANSLKEHVQEFCWDGDEGVSYDEWDDYDYSLDDINLMEDVSNGATEASWGWYVEAYSL